MKIAVIIRNFKRSAGGAERYCVELTERLAIFHEVHVFSQEYEISQSIFKFHKIPKYFEKPRFMNQLLFSMLVRKKTLGNFDIIHSHEMISHANIYTIHVPCFRSILQNLSGIKKVLHYFNTLLSPRKIAYLWLENQQMRQCSNKQFIVVSELLQRNLNECYPLVKNIFIAYPAINNKFLKSDISEVNKAFNLRDKFLLPSSAFILLLVANNFKKKGLPTTLQSLKILDNKNIFLIVVGDGNQSNVLVPKNIKSNVFFIGAVNDIDSVYSNVNLLIHPSLSDTFGMSPLEAMSHKIPVIISNNEYCGFSEHLDSSEALILDNPKDEFEIAEKINYLYKNPEMRKKIAQNGYRKSKSINWEKTLEKTLLAYNSSANK